MANKKKKNKKKKKETETMAPSADSSTPPIDSTQPPREGNPSLQLAEIIEANRRWVNGNQDLKVEMMFSKQLDSSDADPELNRAVIKLYGDEMKKALSLTQQLKATPYIRVLVRDPRQIEHQLRFSKNDEDVGQESYILHHEWGRLVAENGLKEGYTVMGYGNRKFSGNQFKVFLRITQCQESCFLFEKKLIRTDLKQLAIEWCSPKLKRALQLAQGGDSDSYVRVLTQDRNKKVYELRFSRRGITGYSFHHDWKILVANHGLKEGDFVSAFGAPAIAGFTAKIFFSKSGETNLAPIPALFFDKELEFSDINTLLSTLEIENCKEVVKELVATKLEEGEGYVRVSGVDRRGEKYKLRLSRDKAKESYVLYHQWREVISAHGLMVGDKVSCWGHFPGDGTIYMRIDVDKALENI